jgi:hypothetical protein
MSGASSNLSAATIKIRRPPDDLVADRRYKNRQQPQGEQSGGGEG